MPSTNPTRLLSITFVLLCSTVAATAQKKLLSLEQTVGRGEKVDFSGTTPAWSWAEDGLHLLRGRGEEARLVDPRTLEESAPPAPSESAPPAVEGEQEKPPLDPLAEAFLAEPGMDEDTARRIARGRRDESDDERSVLIHSQGELYFVGADGAGRVLTRDSEPGLELVDLAPDGSAVAFVQGNDLHVIDTATGWRRSITSDGCDEVFNGKLDWVYQEEVYGRGDFKGFWWSPDSKRIAFLRLDESQVHEFTVVDFIEPGHFRVRPEIANYPKVGDPNPTVQLGVAEAATGAIKWVDLSKHAADEPIVVRVDWTSAGNEVLFMVQDRIQTWLDLAVADPATGRVRTVLHESSGSWVDRAEEPRWLADGSFLWQSNRSGYRHLYRYRLDGKLVGAVTGGDWAVNEILDVDEERGRIWFTSTKDGAVDSNVYRIGLDGKGLVRLTSGPGAHSVTFCPDKSLFLDRVSSLAAPTEVRVCTGEGEVLHVLGKAEIPDRETYACSDWELVEIRARDGFPLDAAVLKPVPFDASRAHPVWISTYSGPDSPSVRNRWNGSTWSQFLAERGVIVFQVNVRSASGKGHWVIEQCYKQLGVQELADLEDAIDWLCGHPWANRKRVGITGYSYGGFMSAFALTHSAKFALGIAGGGVYDWAMYDTIYTERYMSTPERNPDGYAATSVLKAAANLKGHLVLHHGTGDDNVHMQNVIQLAYALQKAGKPFEIMLYPESAHGIGDRDQSWFARQMEWRAIREYLIEGRTDGDWVVPEPEEVAAGSR